ncbi:unnamed protein product [marine sediment metagenome]|uniref:Uncharacterized protein n=1 Tax=marine sediment metagenome TaxID=412755 RepID=X1G262_9ZZZZ
MLDHTLQIPSGEPKEVSAAASLIPYRRDDERCKYLGYLACGFSDEEALYVLGLTRSWLAGARLDSKFTDLEERIPELRKVLSQEYTELDFYRNFRMVLEKDHRILRKSLEMELVEDEETGEMVPAQLSSFDQQYLLRLRSAYTPQQLQLLEAVVAGDSGGFNFAQWVSKNQEIVQISRTDTISLQRGKGGKETDDS